MKNFSTVGARLVGAALWSAAVVLPAGAVECSFRPDAPDQHVVVKGDTLWDIAGAFLPRPWCWPTVWGMNREQIRDPHWIYPGQIVYFDRAAGRLRLGNPVAASEDGAGSPQQSLSPRVRSQPVARDAIPAIPPGAIEPFLTQPLVVENDELQGAPRIVASQESRVFLGQGDLAYVRGDIRDGMLFQVFRPSKPLLDPVTRQAIAHEAIYLGTLRLRRAGGDVHTFVVDSNKEEMGVGDLLRAIQPAPLQHYVPHPPARPVEARVAAVHGGLQYAGQLQVVSINRGKLDGLDIGAVLQLYHAGKTVADTTAPKGWLGGQPQVRLPDQDVGSLFIFRVFNHVSYGLIMQARAPVETGDLARSPD